MARYLTGMTGASGSIYGVDFARRCPGEKYLVLSDWARQVLHSETGLKPSDLEPHVKKIFSDADLAAPFSSGSNRYDACVIVPCSVSTLAKIAVGIADTLITRAAAVALKERMRMIVCVRETPLPARKAPVVFAASWSQGSLGLDSLGGEGRRRLDPVAPPSMRHARCETGRPQKHLPVVGKRPGRTGGGQARGPPRFA